VIVWRSFCCGRNRSTQRKPQTEWSCLLQWFISCVSDCTV
jgi:hypothetical protein